MRKKSNIKRYLIVGIISIALLLFIFKDLLIPTSGPSSNNNTGNQANVESEGPAFRYDGDLEFLKADTSFKKIKIEIVENYQDRAQGLMYRKHMNEDEGMLFIFEVSELQSFWMKNTYISLDIIYVDANLNIVTMQKYTTPFSENPVPSTKAALYVVEVIAGFCDKYGLDEGDKIKFKRLS
ncbi:MAG TPA: DUF192 domain-containing protein [Bacteroidia bacterium]|nr:DUF192 domain-containing protein [Bacteroidia bacterium]HNT80035.1 DUF192 domain-containing protein [Bacteroidia bacterium]